MTNLKPQSLRWVIPIPLASSWTHLFCPVITSQISMRPLAQPLEIYKMYVSSGAKKVSNFGWKFSELNQTLTLLKL